MKTLHIYWIYVKTFFMARMEYRLNFALGIIANIYSYFVVFADFWIITHYFGDIGGWRFSDMFILYGLNLLTYAFAGTLVWYNVYWLEEEVISGGLDCYLVQPMNILVQLICSRFGDTFIGQIIVSSAFLIIAFLNNAQAITPFILLFFILTVISGTFLQLGAMIIVGSLSFWLDKSTDIGEVFYYQLRSLTHYPLTIFPRWIRVIITYIFPWAFINYYPTLLIIGKAATESERILGYISPLVGFLVFFISLIVFRLGLKVYQSSGS